jgi:hypothetical protein
LANLDAESFFRQLWHFLARQGDAVSALLDLILHVFDHQSLFSVCKGAVQSTADLQQHPTPRAGNALTDFEAVTALCYAVGPGRSFLHSAAGDPRHAGDAMKLVVGTDGTRADLVSALATLGILRSKRGSQTYEPVKAHWSKALLVALELANHGFISSAGRPLPRRMTNIVSILCGNERHISLLLRHGAASLQRMLTDTKHAGSVPSIQWYLELPETPAAKQHLARAANCEAVWKTARGVAPETDAAATAALTLALFTAASGSLAYSRTPGAPPAPGPLASDFLLLASATPGALLILLNCLLCLPFLSCQAVLSQIQSTRLAAPTPALEAALASEGGLAQAVAVARALVGRGVFPDVSADAEVTPPDLWLHSQTALARLGWTLPRASLRALLEEATGAFAAPVMYSGKDELLPPADLSAASFLQPVQLEGESATLYVRPDPWALWLALQ